MKQLLTSILILLSLNLIAQVDPPTPLPYDHIREADVMWEKRVWRVIDFREKMNKPFSYPREPFVSLIIEPAMNAELTVYRDEGFTEALTAEEVKRMLIKVDTFWEIVDDVEVPVPYKTEFNPEDVSKLRIKEDWIFDEETSTMVVRIIGISPVRDVYDDNDEFLGEEPLFWVHFPSSRNHFSKSFAFNPFNDAQKMSWTDVFDARYFASYVIKESNVYDRRISAYAAGIDMVLESERIHEQIRQYEHELWSY